MKRFILLRGPAVGLLLAIATTTFVHAEGASDPSSAQIYQAVRSGNIAEAQQMVAQVLRDHPTNAKAHYVAAEVDAAARNFGLATQELAAAERLEPGLPFANPRAVAELRRQLGMNAGAATLAGARIARAKQDIRSLETALTEYRLDNSVYPTTREGLEALVKQPSDPSISHWHGPYISHLANDPWGHPYQYGYPGTHGQPYDLYTLGANSDWGYKGNSTIIGNWNLDD